MENLVKLTIDGVSVEVPAGTTVLEAAKKAGIRWNWRMTARV